jgi:signal transduction histidine kinase
MGLSLDLGALVVGDLVILTVGALAWRRNYHSGAAQSFFGASLTFAYWLTINYFSVQLYSLGLASWLTHLTYMGGLWAMLVACYFCYRFPVERQPGKGTHAIFLGVLVIGSVFSYSRLVVDHISYHGQQLVISPGPAYVVYGLLLTGVALAAMVALRHNYAQADLAQRNQTRYAAFGVGLGAFFAIFFNVVLVLFNPAWGSPLVNVLITLLIVLFLGYGLIRHRYTDVHRLTAWLFTFVGCFALLAGALLVVNLELINTYRHSAVAQRTGILIAATILIFMIQPIRRQLKLLGDRLLDVGWYDSQALLNTVGTMLAGELHLTPLLDNSLHYLGTELRVTGGELLALEVGTTKISRRALFGRWKHRAHAIEAAVLTGSEEIIIFDELPSNHPLLNTLRYHGVGICVPLRTRGHTVGYLLLGFKQRGDIFSEKDIAVLRIVASQLAVAIVSAQAFEQINQFNNTLQAEISAATVNLRTAHEKLQLDDRLKTEFIILTSHNLRTPLSVVKGYTSLLEETELNEQQRTLLASLKGGTDRLSQFTEDLLAIDSIVAGKPLVLEPVSAAAILLPLAKEGQDLAQAKQLEFKTDLQLQDVMIDANDIRLSGAIRNLLDNACKFTATGQISLSASFEDDKLKIIVADTGIGIAGDELPNLFARFHRATDTMHYEYDGEGIGLYLTNLVIKQHEGDITVRSRLGHGSTFIITLPARLEATASTPDPAA